MKAKIILRSLLLIVSNFIIFSSLIAQPECRSTLGAHMKPIKITDSLVSWAGEFTDIPAYMENRFANNSMLFLGTQLNTKSKKHSLYLEGGFKLSYVTAIVVDSTETQTDTSTTVHKKGKNAGKQLAYLLSPRELYYKFRDDNVQFRLGMGTTKIGDYFLVDERVLGAQYIQTDGAFALQATAGSVSKFARMGDYCATKRLTKLVNKEKYETAGDTIGETNFGAIVMSWNFKEKKSQPIVSTDEFASIEKVKPFSFNKFGLAYYQEYFTKVDTQKYFTGTFFEIGLPFSTTLKAEGLYQSVKGSNAIIYYSVLEKDFLWKNAHTSLLQLGYLGKYEIDKDARFLASFSNLYKGEIMRMDAIDVPLAFATIKHTFNGKSKPYMQVQFAKQLFYEKITETDVEIGATYFKHLKAVGIISNIQSASLQSNDYVAKLELRFGF